MVGNVVVGREMVMSTPVAVRNVKEERPPDIASHPASTAEVALGGEWTGRMTGEEGIRGIYKP